jgi:hypothetical protein
MGRGKAEEEEEEEEEEEDGVEVKNDLTTQRSVHVARCDRPHRKSYQCTQDD